MPPALKVRWTEAAAADLVAAAEYIARDSPHYADSMTDEIRKAARSLFRFSGRGRIVPEFEDPGIREMIIGSYRMIYRNTPREAAILAVIHGARDLPSALRESHRQQQASGAAATGRADDPS